MTVSDRIKALPPGGQLALAAAVLVVVAAILTGAYLAMKPRYEVLFRDLRPADAATIVAELDKNKTPYHLAQGGAVVLVPEAQVDQTRLAIMGSDLPLKGTVGFELFNKSDMGLTEFAQRINYQRALQGELARTIMSIEGVDSARVHLTLPEPSIFRADRKPAEASVMLSPRAGARFSPQTVAGVQRLIAASVPDLDVRDVVVLDASGALVSAAPQSEGSASPTALLQQTRAIEEYYSAAVRTVLEPLYPQVRVGVVVPADQWASDDNARRETLAGWAPDRRSFPLRVEVTAPGGFTPAQQNDVGRLVAAQISWSADQGDSLAFPDWAGFDRSSTEAEPPSPDAAPRAAITPAAAPKPVSSLAAGWWVALALAAVAGVFLVRSAIQRRAPRRLTPQEREAYVARLRRLLAEGADSVR